MEHHAQVGYVTNFVIYFMNIYHYVIKNMELENFPQGRYLPVSTFDKKNLIVKI